MLAKNYEEINSLIEEYEKSRKNIRRRMNQVALAGQGAYQISDMWEMPIMYINEMFEYIVEVREAESEAIKKQSGKRRTTF